MYASASLGTQAIAFRRLTTQNAHIVTEALARVGLRRQCPTVVSGIVDGSAVVGSWRHP